MNRFNSLATVALCGLLLAAVSPATRADVRDRKTTVDFSGPVEVPGTVLPPGKYVFKLVESQSNLNIVRVTNDREDHVYATILAIPNYRMEPTDKTVMTFYEAPSGQPEALRAWFYPGDTYGQEFAYPRPRATQISLVTHQNVPTAPADSDTSALTAPSSPEPAASTAVANPPADPEESPQQIAQVRTPDSPAPASAPAATSAPTADSSSDTKLPETASPMPLVALIGLLSIGAAVGTRSFAKRLS